MRRGGRPRSAARTAEGQEQQGPSMALSQATQGVVSGSPPEGTSRDRFLERAVGTCPMVDLKIRGVLVSCLLDTGSQVSTITEGFFREHLSGNESDVLSTSGWLKITAANGLDIPYLGYMELDVEVMGMTLPECGFLIFKETPSSSAFTTPFGLFEYQRMPFGVCNGPSTFQRLMQAVMSDLIFQVLIVYLDDILLFSQTFEEHLERLEMVLKRLGETGLKVKLGKCCFLQESVRFLSSSSASAGDFS
ncbi:Transposon Ty3-I Gag-Pol poly [Labeo rohita]|uniref:ribonuclease H n=1 Tax=Labeo rohita TaxID=84645 RepID=A0A498P5V3_LABRO|nr:Transposon Ty3-I Gag-Pol poly [Labeo rohita]